MSWPPLGPRPFIPFNPKMLSVVVAALLVGMACSRDEVARVRSPSGNTEAVLIESHGGATTSFRYAVYVETKDEFFRSSTNVASLYGAVRNECAYGVSLKWQNDEHLVVEFLDAKKASLLRPVVEIGSRHVQVSLETGRPDPTAPCGSMFYNVEARK